MVSERAERRFGAKKVSEKRQKATEMGLIKSQHCQRLFTADKKATRLAAACCRPLVTYPHERKDASKRCLLLHLSAISRRQSD